MAVSTASDFVGLLTRRTQLPASPSPPSSYCSGSEMLLKMLKSQSMRSCKSARNRGVSLRCEAKDRLVCPVDKIGIDSKKSNLIALEQLKASAIDRYTKEKSCIAVIGLNHHTVPVEVREKLAIPEEQWAQAISELCNLNHIEEAAVLSTCNRTEIYVVALSQHRGVREVTEWMSKISGIPFSDLCHHRFLLYNNDATKHLFEVASGLDSAVLGEGQILAQVRQVKKLGQGVAGFGRKISGLFEHAIITGKRVRTETNIASGSVSVSSAAVELGQVKLPECSYDSARVLVIGAGKMGKLVIKHLAAKGCTKMVVVNRTEEKVDALRKELKDVEVIYKPLSEMMACASEADMVFTCTASDAPLFLKEHVERLRPVNPKLEKRIFIDISVPRNVEPCVSELQTTEVYNVDDLKEVVAANKEDRQRKAMEAESVISDELHKFEAWKDSLETVPTIKKLRAYMERIRASEVEKCMSKMGDVTDKQKKAIHDLSMGMLKKFLQGPMQHLRIDASDCCKPEDVIENMHAVNRMFDLEKEILLDTVRTKVERSQK